MHTSASATRLAVQAQDCPATVYIELLHAGTLAAESDDPALSLNNNLTDRLHFALGELLDSARTSLDAVLGFGDPA